MDELVTIGRRVRVLRKQRNMTMTQLAVELQISQPYLSNIERGVQQIPLDVLLKVCKVFNIGLKEFFLVGMEHENVELVELLSLAQQLNSEERNAIRHLIELMLKKRN